MSFFGFTSAPVDVDIRLTGEEERKQVEVKGEADRKEMCPVYYDGESVEGQVSYWQAACIEMPNTTRTWLTFRFLCASRMERSFSTTASVSSSSDR